MVNTSLPCILNKGDVMQYLLLSLLAFTLSGCGVMAAPCRITSAVIKMVPVVGHAAAIPTDACADIID